MHATSIKNVTNDHETWKNNLAFYRDEIKIFRNRLDEVADKNNVNHILEKIEHFQNQLDIHDTKMSELKHEIDQYVHQVYQDTKEHANHITKETAEKHETLKAQVGISEKLFEELKGEFKHFLEKVL